MQAEINNHFKFSCKMKKKNSVYFVLLIAGLIFISQLQSCFKKKEQPKVKITKVEKVETGEWKKPTVVPSLDSTANSISEIQYTTEKLEQERDHFKQRYQHYKSEAYKLNLELASINAALLKETDCEGRLEAFKMQLTALTDKGQRDSVLIDQLFAEYDKKGERNEYSGYIEGDNFKTSWRASIFGILPPDGLLLKTDVTAVTTTIEKPYPVWQKNNVEVFAGSNSSLNYMLGIGYERRNKIIGIFGQSEFFPQTNNLVVKGGLRGHF